jgi:acyl-coenzyme A thioesterase PaaI-like protein
VSLRNRLLLRLLSLYPPFLGAGIRVRRLARAPDVYEARMKLRGWNRNVVGTHFGGSLYTMCDPFFMLILIDALGPGFVVWDKSATIRFRRPGRGTVRARFEIAAATIESLRAEVAANGRAEPVFVAEAIGDDGAVVAEIEKVISIKPRRPPIAD